MLEIVGVTKTFGRPAGTRSGGGREPSARPAVDNVNLTIFEGEFFSLLGPSGCGKTTLLRMLGGFETPTAGQILHERVRVDPLPANQRPFNMVFQRYALFPHLSVGENIAFGLKMKSIKPEEIKRRVDEMLSLMKLESFGDRSIGTLSGGQQQRVALARALVNRPKVLLLDEPLSALDLKLRQQMQVELRALQRRLKHTFIFVTHDQEEALALSDRIAVMNGGVVEQVGTPREIYERPATLFVARFIGTINSFDAEVLESEHGSRCLVKGFPEKPVRAEDSEGKIQVKAGQKATVLLRPEKLRLSAKPPLESENGFEASLRDVVFQGANTLYYVQPRHKPETLWVISQPNTTEREARAEGDTVYVLWDPNDSLILPQATAKDAPNG